MPVAAGPVVGFGVHMAAGHRVWAAAVGSCTAAVAGMRVAEAAGK